MTWFDYLLIGWWLLGVALTIAIVGKPRKPIEGSTAALTFFITALLITGPLWTRGAFA